MRPLRALLSLEWLEHPGRTMVVVGLLFALAYVAALTLVPRSRGRLVQGDTIQYYAYLRSMVIDHDLDFTNDYDLLYAPTGDAGAGSNVWLTSTTPIGRRTNQMSIGPAILWAPFFLATYVVLALLRPFGLVVPLDGIAAPFSLSAGVAGVVYATLGAWFCYRACRVLAPQRPAFWGAMTAWLASPAVYYSLVSPAYSHAPSMMASAAFCDVWLRTRNDDRTRRYVWLGLLAGLAALVRWQDIVLLALPALELLSSVRRGRRSLASLVQPLAVAAATALLMLLPQLVAWNAIYGQPLVMPQGPGFMRWTSPALFSVLFSLRHGLLSWTPALIVALAGFWFVIRRDALVGWSVLAVFVVTVYINASVSDWWAGEAFGARRFVSDTVFFALGFACLFAQDFWTRRPTAMRWAATAMIVCNLLFLLQYQVFMHGLTAIGPYPATVQQVLFDRFTLPWRLFGYLMR
jgi:hypothetical protein